MSDNWEEGRLESREAFIDRHKVSLSDGESQRWVLENLKLELAYESLLEATKFLKEAVFKLTVDFNVDSQQTLRAAYSSVAKLPVFRAEGAVSSKDMAESDLAAVGDCSRAFGQAIGAILHINRLVVDVNQIKLDIADLQRRFRNLALVKLGDYAPEFEKATLPIDLSTGETIYVKPDFEPTEMSGISLANNLASIYSWRAVGP